MSYDFNKSNLEKSSIAEIQKSANRSTNKNSEIFPSKLDLLNKVLIKMKKKEDMCKMIVAIRTYSKELSDKKLVSKKETQFIKETIEKLVTDTLVTGRDQCIKNLLNLFKISKPVCENCNFAISDVHYTCSKCTNYFLCKSCEENQIHPHDLFKRRHLK